MTTEISFSDRDFRGTFTTFGTFKFTSWDDTTWTRVQVGGLNTDNASPVHKLIVTGSVTSPASFSTKDRLVELEVMITRRGEVPNTGFSTFRVPLLYFKSSQTSTNLTIQTPIEIPIVSQGYTSPDVYIRISGDDLTYTSPDFYVRVLGSNEISIPLTADTYSSTNNLYASAISAYASTVETLPTSTDGYISYKITTRGYFGDTKSDVRVGLSRTTDPLDITVPRYCFDISNGFSPLCRILENGSQVQGDIAFVEGDVMTVQRNASGHRIYKQNGTTIRTETSNPDTVVMKGHLTSPNQYGRMLNVRADIGAGEISPSFENTNNIVEF